jgi:hypothetical protein
LRAARIGNHDSQNALAENLSRIGRSTTATFPRQIALQNLGSKVDVVGDGLPKGACVLATGCSDFPFYDFGQFMLQGTDLVQLGAVVRLGSVQYCSQLLAEAAWPLDFTQEGIRNIGACGNFIHARQQNHLNPGMLGFNLTGQL